MWEEALEDAEEILEMDTDNVQAIFCRAESMFNLCKFENSLCAFYRGQVFTLLLYFQIHMKGVLKNVLYSVHKSILLLSIECH